MYLALIAAVRLQLYVGQRPNKRMMELIQFYLSGIAELDELEVLLAEEIARVGRAKARVKKAGGGRGKTAGGAVRAEPCPKGAQRPEAERSRDGMENSGRVFLFTTGRNRKCRHNGEHNWRVAGATRRTATATSGFGSNSPGLKKCPLQFAQRVQEKLKRNRREQQAHQARGDFHGDGFQPARTVRGQPQD